MSLVPRPGNQLPGIAAIREDLLDKGEPPPGPLRHPLGSIAVLDIGANREQPAVGVGQGESSWRH